MSEYYVDIRCKVEADSIEDAMKIAHKKTAVDDDLDSFIKAVGISLEYRDKMVGDSYYDE